MNSCHDRFSRLHNFKWSLEINVLSWQFFCSELPVAIEQIASYFCLDGIMHVFSHHKLYLPKQPKCLDQSHTVVQAKVFGDFHGAQMVQEFKEKKRFTAEEAKRILLDISKSASSGDYI